MVKFTLIRHGESMDNLTKLWAGWRNSSLTNHGMNQAIALGKSLSNTPITVIHTSDLLRAVSTAEAIQKYQCQSPPIIPSQLLREQNFGDGEGKLYQVRRRPDLTLGEHYSQGIFPSLHGSRSEKFPGGESLDDVARRADKAVRDIFLPYVQDEDVLNPLHVAVTSHGIFIRELVEAITRLDPCYKAPLIQPGMQNTAWMRVVVELKSESYKVNVTNINNDDHLKSVIRQKGGIGSSSYDPKQKGIQAFFKRKG